MMLRKRRLGMRLGARGSAKDLSKRLSAYSTRFRRTVCWAPVGFPGNIRWCYPDRFPSRVIYEVMEVEKPLSLRPCYTRLATTVNGRNVADLQRRMDLHAARCPCIVRAPCVCL